MMRPSIAGGRSSAPADQAKRLSSASAPRNDRKANIPNIKSAQEPTDMGDQYLNIGRKVLDSISICQKRTGRVRSSVNSKPLITMHGNAM